MTEPIALSSDILLSAYAAGVFPMGTEGKDDTLYWVDPPMRGVIPLDGLHVSRSLRKRIRRGGFEVRVDCDFIGTMKDCADRSETWINAPIYELYGALHRRGFAHSVEVWADEKRIGGLYGVRLGSAFFGESMFSQAPDASKIALVYLVARLNAGGFILLDTQFTTEHLCSMGAVEITRAKYRETLGRSIQRPADFHGLAQSTDIAKILDLAGHGNDARPVG